MNPERWNRIKSVYGEAMEREGPEREAFLAEACGPDRDLRAEVETLLRERGATVLQSPIQERNWVRRTLGRFRVLEKIGQGGMGVIYKAEDTQLQRTVALKFLSAEVSGSEELKARLIREAQAAAALDHPNICAVHDIHEEQGETFIAMAYIDGLSLAQKIKERPLPLDEALDIAIQIGEGLQAAHEKGIVHRDMKPHNVMLTAKDQVKVMDFGLASIGGRSELTKSGTILGTLSYMAPEQLEGREADRRADLWALGCVLYEMLTQRTPFEFAYREAIEYGIRNEEPDPVTALRGGLPIGLDDLLAKTLAKDPAERYQHADDLLVDLRRLKNKKNSRKEIVSDTNRPPLEEAPVPPPIPSPWVRWLPWVLLALTAAGWIWYVNRGQPPPEIPLRKFALNPEIPVRTLLHNSNVAMSPDGRHIAYVAGASSAEAYLWVQDLDREQPRRIAETRGAYSPAWSRDSRTIFFGDWNAFVLKRVGVEGGPVTRICEAQKVIGIAADPKGDRLVFSDANPARLFEVPVGGGTPKRLHSDEQMEAIHSRLTNGARTSAVRPSFLDLASGKPLLMFHLGWSSTRVQRIMLQSSEAENPTELRPGLLATYSPTGHLLYQEGADLWALPFNPDGLEVQGEPFLVREKALGATVADDGTLVYLDHIDQMVQLTRVDRNGRRLETIGQPEAIATINPVRVSPDGEKVAYETIDNISGELWVFEMQRGVRRRVTSDPAYDYSPTWSPDSQRIVYSSNQEGDYDIYVKDPVSSAEAQKIRAHPDREVVTDWSRDGRIILYRANRVNTGADLLYLQQNDQEEWESHPLLETPFGEFDAKMSPDGRYFAYSSGESGRGEVYVRRFPDGQRSFQVSTDGGSGMRWNADGGYLFYVDREQYLVAVEVETDPEFSIVRAERLFAIPPASTARGWDVFPDGRSFLIPTPVGDSPRPSIRVVQNWYEEFRDHK